MIDSTVSHYHILEHLGGGGMGVVYKARDLRLNNLVALKFLPAEFCTNTAAKKRFIQEAQAAAALDHQNICVIHDIDETDDLQLFICMNYYEGETLKKKLEHGTPSIKETLGIAVQIARGMTRAHEAGILHRDIKPANIMLTLHGEVKIVDFGLAKLAGHARLTKTHGVVGTLTYMSPEQTCGQEVDARTDIWSLGVLLYEMVTGKLPFASEYEAVVLYSILNEDITPPSTLNPEIQQELEEIINRALQKNPADRYESMQEMLNDLIHCSRMLEDSEERTIPKTPRFRRKLKKQIRNRLLAVVLVFLAVTVSSGVFWLYSARQPVYVFIHQFDNQAASANYAPMVMDQLADKLDQSGSIRILSRFRIADLQKQLQIDSLTMEAAFRIARESKMQFLMQGAVLETGSLLRLNVRAYDVATKNRLFSWNQDGPNAAALLPMINDLAVKIRDELPHLPFTAYSPETDRFETPSNFFEANLKFSAGKTYYYVDPAKAIGFFEQAVAIDSTFLAPYLQLAMLYDFLGNTQKALVYTGQARQLTNTHYPRELLKTLAMETWIEKDWDTCINYLQRYLEITPEDLQSLQRLGYIMLHRKNDYDRALELFQQVEQMDPDNLSGKLGANYNYIGMAFQQKGERDKSLSAYHAYRIMKPNEADPLHSLGAAYQYFGDYPKAIEYYQTAINVNPEFYFIYKDLALTYMDLGRWRDAREKFQRYMAAVPKDRLYEAHLYLAEMYLRQNNYTSADHELKEASERREVCIKRCWLAGLLALRQDNDILFAEERLKEMEAALEHPAERDNDVYIYHLRGRVALAGGDDTTALYFLRQSIKVAHWGGYYFRRELVRGLLECGRYEQVLEKGQELLAINEHDAELLVLLGRAYGQLGEAGDATDYFERARKVWQGADDDFVPLLALDTLQIAAVTALSNN